MVAIATIVSATLALLACALGEENDTTLEIMDGSPTVAQIFGMNDVLGPIFALPYDDAGLMDAVSSLRVGLLRYPGGTVANYWSYQDANYVPSCDPKKVSCCGNAPKLAQRGPQTFSPTNFSRHVNAATMAGTRGQGAVWDLNVFTHTSDEIVSELEYLASTGVDVRQLEFGNEFYLPQYNWTTIDYLERVTAGVAAARRLFPEAKLALVATHGNLHQNPSNYTPTSWNAGLAANLSAFDAVTIHDYTMRPSMVHKLAPQHNISFILAYSDAVFQNIKSNMPKVFGKEVPVWMTEYNWGTIKGMQDPNGGVHALYLAARIIAAINVGVVDTLMMHALVSEPGVAWDATAGIIRGPNATTDTFEANGVAQVFSHLARAGLELAETMHPVFVRGGGVVPIEVLGHSDLPCLQAAAFTKQFCNGTEGGAVAVLNRCDSVQTLSKMPAPFDALVLDLTIYAATDAGGWAPLPDASSPVPWVEGPMRTTQSQAQGSKPLNVPALALVIAAGPRPFADGTELC